MTGESKPPIVVKRIKRGGGKGHAAAWKIAYADFVTAMMAFFLLMWLINTTSPEQKRGIADYFAPASVSETTSGAGGILGGNALGSDGQKSAGSASIIEELADAHREDRGEEGKVLDYRAPHGEREVGKGGELRTAFGHRVTEERGAREEVEHLAGEESLEVGERVAGDGRPLGMRPRQDDDALEAGIAVE